MKILKALTQEDTQKISISLVPLLRSGDIIALWGTLGSGKTAFTRYLIQHLLHRQESVPSPTFTLLQVYDTDLFPVYHFDLYRLEKPNDAYELGIEEAFIDAVSIIEWPEKMGSLLPAAHRLNVRIKVENTTRIFIFESTDFSWKERINSWQITL